ncbi:MAG TPA: SH3 domain-containing protein, partial [Pyrinomonadaceae bacterium]
LARHLGDGRLRRVRLLLWRRRRLRQRDGDDDAWAHFRTARLPGLLLGIQYQVRSRQRSTARAGAPTTTGAPAANPASLQAGREMLTTTNVNLRSGPGRTYNRIGEVEGGSRVRVLKVSGNWCEVEIIQRGVPRIAEESADTGWLDGTRLR